MNVCFCCVFSVFQYYAKRLARKNVSNMTYFVLVGRKTLTQSFISSFVQSDIDTTTYHEQLDKTDREYSLAHTDDLVRF